MAQNVLDKVGKLIPRLASDHAGEVAATAAAIVRTLGGAGMDLHDVVRLMQREPVERIVYRERVVYREKAPSPPQVDEPEGAMSPEAALAAATMLIGVPDLTEKQRSFVRYVFRRASDAKRAFTLSPKQWIWLNDMVERHATLD